jgi:hypothetical protein
VKQAASALSVRPFKSRPPLQVRGHSICTPIDGESVLMSVASLSHDLYGFAIELRQLAYTMPGGHEDPLIRLSERMVSHAQHEVAKGAKG